MMLPAILKRRAVRSFRSDPISDELLSELIAAAQCAPSAHGNRSVQFVVIRDPEAKRRIHGVIGQDFVRDAPVLIVPVLDPAKSVAPVQDISVASENIFLQAAEGGLGTVWKNMSEPGWAEGVKQILGIPMELLVINLIPVGLPQGEVAPHQEADFDATRIHQERW